MPNVSSQQRYLLTETDSGNKRIFNSNILVSMNQISMKSGSQRRSRTIQRQYN